MTVARVTLWGVPVGAVQVRPGESVATFEYDRSFIHHGIEVSPLSMPIRLAPYAFPSLPADAFSGLPGLLADALPDRWGTALVDAWLASRGRSRASFNVVERLCYVGRRGMGALEFEPAIDAEDGPSGPLDVAELVELAGEVLTRREGILANLTTDRARDAMHTLLSIGTSAGGARPKAVIAFDEATGEVRSGQLDLPPSFTHWLLKFDAVAGSGDHGLADPDQWGIVEYVYFEMARAAGVEISECRLLDEGGRRHFMTRRFDRDDAGRKVHVQTVGALLHASYNEPGLLSYEGVAESLRALGIEQPSIEQWFTRMVFNVVAANHDDHVKNTACTMDQLGVWRLAPAYDLTFASVQGNRWLEQHQMVIAGKRRALSVGDLRDAAASMGIRRVRAEGIIEQVRSAVARWSELADAQQLRPERIEAIANAHDLLDR